MAAEADGRHIGYVKWFNNKTGYGFLRNKEDKDIFVHHQNIVVGSKQYKYLVQGEYVEYDLELTPWHTDHSVQAVDVTGIYRGKLMCETRHEIRMAQIMSEAEDDDQHMLSFTQQFGSNIQPLQVQQQQQQPQQPRQHQNNPRGRNAANNNGAPPNLTLNNVARWVKTKPQTNAVVEQTVSSNA